MEIVDTWYFQIWVNFGGMAVHTEYLGFMPSWLKQNNVCRFPNKPEHVFRSLTPRVRLFCQMVIMLQLHNAG